MTSARGRFGAKRLPGNLRPSSTVAFVVVSFLWAARGLAAAPGMSVTVFPAVLDLQVSPGSSASQTVYFINRGAKALNVHGEVWDYSRSAIAPGSMGTVGSAWLPSPAGSGGDTMTSWFTLQPSVVLIPAAQTGQLRVTVSVPQGTRGGRYAAIYLAAHENSDSGDTAGMALGAEIMVKVLVDTGATNPGLRCKILMVTPPTPTNKLKFVLELQNTGDVHVWAEPTVDLLGPVDDFVATVVAEQPKVLLMPGDRKVVELTWGGNLAPARYEAMATAYFGPTQAATDEREFTVADPTLKPATPPNKVRPPPHSVSPPTATPPAGGAPVVAPEGKNQGALTSDAAAAGNGQTAKAKKKVKGGGRTKLGRTNRPGGP